MVFGLCIFLASHFYFIICIKLMAMVNFSPPPPLIERNREREREALLIKKERFVSLELDRFGSISIHILWEFLIYFMVLF